MRLKELRTVKIMVLYGGKPEEWTAGVGYRDVEPPFTSRLFGLMHPRAPESMTHFAYGLDQYFQPAEVIERLKTDKWFYFDAGTTCTEIKASAAEMERVFRELGLIENG
jgi:hypothetical protein